MALMFDLLRAIPTKVLGEHLSSSCNCHQTLIPVRLLLFCWLQTQKGDALEALSPP